MMLLNDILPVFDFTEMSTVQVNTSPDNAFRAILDASLAEVSGVVRMLMFLRTLPERVVGRKDEPWDPHKPFLPQACRTFFTELVREPPREIVFGLIVPGDIGRVWKKIQRLEYPPY
jgi:hypothetical protein